MFVLAYDLGGTKLGAAVVNSKGRVFKKILTPLDKNEHILPVLVRVGKKFLQEFPKISRIGIASAGPLHSEQGRLINPTNMKFQGKLLGQVPIVKFIKKNLGLPTYLENDAAASVLAEHWIGGAQGFSSAMILTLGTGLGTGVMIENKLLRGGRGLHTEAGHLILNAADKTAPCGCGNHGCAEAYLSGKNFGERFYQKYGITKDPIKIIKLAKNKDKNALLAFQEYAFYFAVALHNYCVTFSPEIVLLTGSFASASDLFLNLAKRELKILLKHRRSFIDQMPQIKLAQLKNAAGLMGGAFVGLNAGRY